jgi:hypothetical protein
MSMAVKAGVGYFAAVLGLGFFWSRLPHVCCRQHQQAGRGADPRGSPWYAVPKGVRHNRITQRNWRWMAPGESAAAGNFRLPARGRRSIIGLLTWSGRVPVH